MVELQSLSVCISLISCNVEPNPNRADEAAKNGALDDSQSLLSRRYFDSEYYTCKASKSTGSNPRADQFKFLMFNSYSQVVKSVDFSILQILYMKIQCFAFIPDLNKEITWANFIQTFQNFRLCCTNYT